MCGACLKFYWGTLPVQNVGYYIIVIWFSGCTVLHPVQCMFWFQHVSYEPQ